MLSNTDDKVRQVIWEDSWDIWLEIVLMIINGNSEIDKQMITFMLDGIMELFKSKMKELFTNEIINK